MATWHKYLVDNGTLKADKKLQKELEGKVEKKLKEFDEKIEVCEKEEGDVDVRDAMVDRAEDLIFNQRPSKRHQRLRPDP